MNDTKILVTGGAGFIGSHLTKELVKRGYQVVVLDNLSRNVNHVEDLWKEGEIKFLKGDIREKAHVLTAMKGVDYVFHQAAACLNRCKAFPKEAIEVNLEGSYNVFGAAIHENVKKVIYASTSSVYGQPNYLPMDEKHPTNAREPYGATKLCVDKFMEFLSAKHGLKYIGFRYFNVYGTYQSVDAYYTSVINIFIKRILNGQSPRINGDGEQSMDFTHVSDVVAANIAALNSDVENEMFNVGYGQENSLKMLANFILTYLGSDLKPEFIPREILVSRRRCDNSKLKKLLRVECKIDLETGLKELVEHVKKYPEIY
ncbi:MAG: SDR family NAD(P)-dependent oxidoreductase [Candidatus Cloacimonetes bacterium]|jgi:UDP-glucose 4-epimerase|nr:SDR family NAD(P)-dependent oxidoreductase [Candidatus Cloacimonadota bacterium]